MCVTATAKRRRRQATNNYRHLGPMVRPKFRKRSTDVLNAREARARERRKELQQRGLL